MSLMNELFKTCDYLEEYVLSNKVISEEELGFRKVEFVSNYTNHEGFLGMDYPISYIHYLSQKILGYDE